MTRREFLVEVGGLVELPKLNGKSFADVIGGLIVSSKELIDEPSKHTLPATSVLLQAFHWMATAHGLSITMQDAFDYFDECSEALSRTTYMYFCDELTNGPTLQAGLEQEEAQC